MMDILLKWLPQLLGKADGKKTYAVAVVFAFLGVIGGVTGVIPLSTALYLISASGFSSTIRSAITKVQKALERLADLNDGIKPNPQPVPSDTVDLGKL